MAKNSSQRISSTAVKNAPRQTENGRLAGSREGQFLPTEIEQRIRERAYILWEKRGRPNGNERQDWIEAEKQVCRELRIT